MKEQLRELINNEQISEPEVMDVVLGYHKLVKLGMLNETDFEILQMTLGIFEVSPGVFSLNEDETYTLGEIMALWRNGLAHTVTACEVLGSNPRGATIKKIKKYGKERN